MLYGLDLLSGHAASSARRRLRGARVGLLTHAAAVDRRGRATLDVLEELGADVSLVFTPEHGYAGAAQAEVAVPEGESSGRRRVSLYGSSRESLTPRAEDLGAMDLLVVDLVDVGSRYYTYVWTALLAARAAASASVHTLLLDRPNPLGANPSCVEGTPQQEGYLSFVGLESVPIRHGMTLAELVALFIERDGHCLGSSGALSVVPTAGWERQRTASAWGRPFIPPSPNMPTLETALVYPGGCLLEGTNLSEGRGTTTPFQLVGAPFLNGQRLAEELLKDGVMGALVRPASFQPTFDKHAGKICEGVMVHVTHPDLFRPVATYLRLIALAKRQAPSEFAFRTTPYEFENETPAFDLLSGSSQARELIDAEAPLDALLDAVCPAPLQWTQALPEAEERVQRAAT